jgi:hypothetical protein
MTVLPKGLALNDLSGMHIGSIALGTPAKAGAPDNSLRAFLASRHYFPLSDRRLKVEPSITSVFQERQFLCAAFGIRIWLVESIVDLVIVRSSCGSQNRAAQRLIGLWPEANWPSQDR